MAYFKSVRTVVVSAVMVALVAATGIYAFSYWARQAADAELLLVKISMELHTLNSLEWQAISKGKVDAGLEKKAFESRKRIDELKAAIKGTDDFLDEFNVVYRDFILAMDQEYRLIKSGKLDEARAFDDTLVDPLFDKLHDKIEEISVEMATAKERIGSIADVGMALSLVSAALIVASMFSGFTARQIRQAKKLRETRELALHHERIKEEERKRIARDIHDELGQNLMALRLDVVRMTAAPDLMTATKEQIEAALNQIDTTIKSVRTIINDLRPAVLDLGLHAAIEWQAKEFERRSGIACDVHIDHAEFSLDDQRATALFRSVQESLNNIIRHAQARQVWIDMQLKDGQLYMTISDDGVGGNLNSRKKDNAFGLIGIEERMHALGGTFSVASEPGHGVTIMLSIPV